MVKKILGTMSFLGGLLACVTFGIAMYGVYHADNIVIPNQFSAGTIADPSQVNANFDAIKTVVNGKIDNDNWDSAGPDLACSNLDLTAACATTTFIQPGAASANYTLASPSDIASATICGATGAFNDVSGASWSVAGGVGGTIVAHFHATSIFGTAGAICAGGAAQISFRWNINGVAYNAMVIPADMTGSGGVPIDAFGVGTAAGTAASPASTTLKLQCSCSGAVNATGSLKNMRAMGFELKR